MVQVYRMHNGSQKLLLGLEMSIVHNYNNAYVEWQFTWINIHRYYLLIIFNKIVVQQGIGAMITIPSVHSRLWKLSVYMIGSKMYTYSYVNLNIICIEIRRNRVFFGFFTAVKNLISDNFQILSPKIESNHIKSLTYMYLSSTNHRYLLKNRTANIKI